MMAMTTPAQPEYGEELRARLLERFERRGRAFTRLGGTTLVFALAFLAFVLVPLVALQHDEKAVTAALTALPAERAALEGQLAVLEETQAAATEALDKEAKRFAQQSDALIQLMVDADKMELELERLGQAIDLNIKKRTAIADELRAFQEILGGFGGLAAFTADVAIRELRADLGGLYQLAYDAPAERRMSQGTCAIADPGAFLQCKVRHKVEAQLATYRTTVHQTVIQPLRQVDAAAAAEVKRRVAETMTTLDAKVAANPDFFRTVRGKEGLYLEYEDQLRTLFADLQAVVTAKRNSVRAMAADIEQMGAVLAKNGSDMAADLDGIRAETETIKQTLTEAEAEKRAIEARMVSLADDFARRVEALDALQRRKMEISEDKERIRARLDNVESPFGSLPVGLDEAVLAFPLIVAAGALLASLALGDQTRLRREYHLLTRAP